VSKPVVILISGFARAGKDTLADAIIERVKRHHPCAVAGKHPFAKSLKDAADEFLTHLNLFPDSSTVGFHNEDFKKKHRQALVEMGRVARSINIDVFAEKTAYDIFDSYLSDCIDWEGPHIYVIPDWRYLNEHKVITSYLVNGEDPFRMVSVRVDTEGVLPANQEELESLAQIRRNIAVDYEFVFPPNGKDNIERAARDICFQLGLLP
jgi:hypothetical protein